MKEMNNAVDKEFANEIRQLIDKRHKEKLREVDYHYRSLKYIFKLSKLSEIHGSM